MHRTRAALITLGTLCAAAAATAQTTAPPTLRADWQRDRGNVLAYVDAMPESALAFRPTPGVRTFAQQIAHVVESDVDVAALALLGRARAPVLGDSAQYLHHQAALHAYVAAAYDFVLSAMAQATAAQWRRRSSMYGQPPEPPARWFDLAHEHSVWTLGQVVPYLRLNGVTPPPYQMPF